MANNADPLLSAQVVLKRPAESGSLAAAEFRRLGFDVGPLVGTSFAVTAPRSRFEERFGSALVSDGRGSWRPRDVQGYELDHEALPEPLRELVDVVTFTPPPDFGPTSW
jgi:hypothetical protein